MAGRSGAAELVLRDLTSTASSPAGRGESWGGQGLGPGQVLGEGEGEGEFPVGARDNREAGSGHPADTWARATPQISARWARARDAEDRGLGPGQKTLGEGEGEGEWARARASGRG
jgi:hypothetical protein